MDSKLQKLPCTTYERFDFILSFPLTLQHLLWSVGVNIVKNFEQMPRIHQTFLASMSLVKKNSYQLTTKNGLLEPTM